MSQSDPRCEPSSGFSTRRFAVACACGGLLFLGLWLTLQSVVRTAMEDSEWNSAPLNMYVSDGEYYWRSLQADSVELNGRIVDIIGVWRVRGAVPGSVSLSMDHGGVEFEIVTKRPPRWVHERVTRSHNMRDGDLVWFGEIRLPLTVALVEMDGLSDSRVARTRVMPMPFVVCLIGWCAGAGILCEACVAVKRLM